MPEPIPEAGFKRRTPTRTHVSLLLWWLGIATLTTAMFAHILIGVVLGLAMLISSTVMARRAISAYVGIGLWASCVLFGIAGAPMISFVMLLLYLVQANMAYHCRIPAWLSRFVEPDIREADDVDMEVETEV